MIKIQILLLSVFFLSGMLHAQQNELAKIDIYTGYYSQEGNYEELGQTTGHSHYVKFYPDNRISRMFVPFPYSRSVKPAEINRAFDAAIKQTSGSAYIRDKFGVMDKQVVVHLDFYRLIDGQMMYDCSNAAPCKIKFSDAGMIITKPGVVLEHEIRYSLVKE